MVPSSRTGMAQIAASHLQSTQEEFTTCFQPCRKHGFDNCKKAKANGGNIAVARSKKEQSPTKQARRLASAVESHCSKINILTVQNKKMMTTFVTLAIDIPKPDC